MSGILDKANIDTQGSQDKRISISFQMERADSWEVEKQAKFVLGILQSLRLYSFSLSSTPTPSKIH
jgi:hypothetical protein